MSRLSSILLGLYVITSSLGLIILKLGTASGFLVSHQNNKIVFNFNLHTIAGLVLYGISFFMYIYLLSKNDLGYIVPMAAAFVYIFIFIGSYLIFHEIFTITKILGIVLILGGVMLLNFHK